MTLKYDFNISQGNNLFMDTLMYTNNNTSGFFVYVAILMISLTMWWVFNRYMDDFTLSTLYTLYISTIFGIIFYYAGLSMNTTFFSGNLLIGLILIVSGFTAYLYYDRNKLGGD